METKDSLPLSKELATCPDPELHERNPPYFVIIPHPLSSFSTSPSLAFISLPPKHAVIEEQL
jgi:hypothetical protein